MKIHFPFVAAVWGGLLCSVPGSAQPGSPAFPKGAYVDSTGRYYQRANLPAYLFVAPTNSAEAAVPLSQANGSPVYLDGHGKHLLRHRDTHHQRTETFEIYADGRAPRTQFALTGAPVYRSGEKTFYGAGLRAELTATDEYSGVQQVLLATDSGEFRPYRAESFGTFTEGEYAFRYRSVDQVGNEEPPRSKAFVVDLTPPITYHNITGFSADSVVSTASKMYLTAEDARVGVAATYYRLDSLPWQRYNGRYVPFTTLEDGPHRLSYYSEDYLGNRETTGSVDFYFDKIAPIIASDVLGDRFVANGQVYFSGRTKLKLTAVDNKSGIKEVKYAINQESFEDYQAPFYLPSSPGIHQIRFYAVDNAANEGGRGQDGNAMAQYRHNVTRVYVDLVGPKISHWFRGKTITIGDSVFIGPDTDVVLSATDGESGTQYVAYALDGKPGEVRYEGPFQIKKHGAHQLSLFAYDNVNNRNRTELTLAVDTTGPAVSVDFSIKPVRKGVYPPIVSVFLSATDADTGIDKLYYRLNGGTERPYVGPLKELKPGHSYTLAVRAVDYVGNEAVVETRFATSE